MRSVLAAGVGALMLAVLTACGGSAIQGPVFVDTAPQTGMRAIVLPKPYQVSEAALIDTDGQTASLPSVATKPITLVFFGFTNCDDVCPTTLGNIAAALARVSDEHRQEIGLVFVTSDPARDDPQTLRRYLDRYDPAFVGLTGEMDQIVATGDSLGVYVEMGEPLASGGYEVTHGDHVIGILPDGTAPLLWTSGFTSKQLAADLTEVLDSGVPDITN